jgi:uncharacterized protein YqiB (DUF1249 family)
MIYESIYAQLEQLGVIALIREDAEAAKSESGGYMDLHFDRLYESEGGVVISLAHYFKQNGDLCCDPDMEIRVLPERKLAEALTFQQAIPPIYQMVYPEAGKVNPSLQKSLNDFLLTWLRNCVAQGHRFGNPESGA